MVRCRFCIAYISLLLALPVLTACRVEATPPVAGEETAVPLPPPLPSPTNTQVTQITQPGQMGETAVASLPAPTTSTPAIIATHTAVFTPSPPPHTATPPPAPLPATSIVVNHTSVSLFDQIPEAYLQAAAALNMAFVDRSVGFNIHQALDCLQHETNATAPSYCKRWQHVPRHPEFNSDPNEVNWNRAGGYGRSNWHYYTWPQVGDPSMQVQCTASTGMWFGYAECFEQWATGVLDKYQVLSFQTSYLEVENNSSIADQPGGFFWDNPNRYDVYDLQAFVAQHPDHVFIYWTTSLARSIGTPVSASFNEQMRQYAIVNGFPLFDVADILSHTPDGTPCYDNRDGIPYDNGHQSENYPDDGLDIPAICPHYTTETDGGHLGSVSTGAIRVAKAFWVLMAQIAGWQP